MTLRVNPDIDARSHPYISTGLRDNKFGVDIAAAPGILARARAMPGIEVVGRAMPHRVPDPLDWTRRVRRSRPWSISRRRLLAEGFRCARSTSAAASASITRKARGRTWPLSRRRSCPACATSASPCSLEPGRSLVARAGVLLTRVLYVKENHGKRFVIVDAGMNDLLRPALYKAHHRIEPVRARGRASRNVDVVGPVCETADAFARDRELESVEPGELLAIRDAGAYGFAMASTYNMRPRPAEVMIEDGTRAAHPAPRDVRGPRRHRGRARGPLICSADDAGPGRSSVPAGRTSRRAAAEISRMAASPSSSFRRNVV